jgi:hypothetical protein
VSTQQQLARWKGLSQPFPATSAFGPTFRAFPVSFTEGPARFQCLVRIALNSPPRTCVVVELDMARLDVDVGRVQPVGQLDEQPGGLATQELGGAVDGLGQSEPAAGGLDGRGVTDLGPDRDVGQREPPRCACQWGCRRDGAAANVGVDVETDKRVRNRFERCSRQIGSDGTLTKGQQSF